jgi:hypothetical protein
LLRLTTVNSSQSRCPLLVTLCILCPSCSLIKPRKVLSDLWLSYAHAQKETMSGDTAMHSSFYSWFHIPWFQLPAVSHSRKILNKKFDLHQIPTICVGHSAPWAWNSFWVEKSVSPKWNKLYCPKFLFSLAYFYWNSEDPKLTSNNLFCWKCNAETVTIAGNCWRAQPQSYYVMGRIDAYQNRWCRVHGKKQGIHRKTCLLHGYFWK